MAYKNLEINPTKYKQEHTIKRSQFYKGFSTVSNTLNTSKIYDFELIKQDIINNFSVRKNERVMNPSFGTSIWDLLYEPFTDETKSQIGQDVVKIISKDPRVNATLINIIEQEYGMLLEITLEYVGTDQSGNIKISFDKAVGIASV
jgi:phage baseplate assembly protein W